MKKIFILMFIFVLTCQTAQAKAKRIGEVWVFDSRPKWSKTVKVNPDREGAKFIHEYMPENFNIYESADIAVRKVLHYKARYKNNIAYETGHIYYRVAKYDIASAKNEKAAGKDYSFSVSLAKARIVTRINYAWGNRKAITNNKIIVLPQTIDNWNWVVGDVLINQDSFVFEYIPEDCEPYGKSEEVFSIEFVNKNFAKDLDEYKYKFEMYNKLYQQDLGFKYEEKELSRSDEGFTWYWGFGDNNENVVMAVKEVEDGYFRIAYLKYNSISKKDIDKWQKITEERIKELQ